MTLTEAMPLLLRYNMTSDPVALGNAIRSMLEELGVTTPAPVLDPDLQERFDVMTEDCPDDADDDEVVRAAIMVQEEALVRLMLRDCPAIPEDGARASAAIWSILTPDPAPHLDYFDLSDLAAWTPPTGPNGRSILLATGPSFVMLNGSAVIPDGGGAIESIYYIPAEDWIAVLVFLTPQASPAPPAPAPAALTSLLRHLRFYIPLNGTEKTRSDYDGVGLTSDMLNHVRRFVAVTLSTISRAAFPRRDAN